MNSIFHVQKDDLIREFSRHVYGENTLFSKVSALYIYITAGVLVGSLIFNDSGSAGFSISCLLPSPGNAVSPNYYTFQIGKKYHS